MHPGLQLYTLTLQLEQDFEGTLESVARIGFREVELARLGGHKPADLRTLLSNAGLVCRSGHLIHFWQLELEANIETAAELGLKYLVAPIPWKRDVSGIEPDLDEGPYALPLAVINSLTLDDWKWNADLLDRTGERIRSAGLEFAYHNHNFEFHDLGGVRGFDEMLRLTDPELVKLELDPGWMYIAGVDPLHYLTHYKDRVRLLHGRDFASNVAQTTRLSLTHAPGQVPLGTGSVGWAQLMKAAHETGVDGFFLEREPHPGNMQTIAEDYAGWAAIQ